MIINVHKAQRIGVDATDDLLIIGKDEIKTADFKCSDALQADIQVFEDDAKLIAKALLETLPGGTVDALLRELLLIKASHFVVRF